MEPNTNSLKLKNLLLVFIALIAIAIVYELSYTIYVYQTTGTLNVDSPGAFLSVEEEGTKVANIGTTTTKVRLKPGAYILTATKGLAQTSKSFIIYKGKVTNEDFTVTQPTSQPTSQADIEANKLINFLPFIGPNFSYEVDFKYNIASNAATPVIVVTAPNSTSQQAALNWITAVGFNPSALNIQYVSATPQPLANSQ